MTFWPFQSPVKLICMKRPKNLDISLLERHLIRKDANELPHDKTKKNEYAPSEDSDQSGHPPNLIRVFTVHFYADSEDSNQTGGDAQVDLSLHWAHMPFWWFCHEAAQIKCCIVFAMLTLFQFTQQFAYTAMILSFRTPKTFVVITLKFELCGFTID